MPGNQGHAVSVFEGELQTPCNQIVYERNGTMLCTLRYRRVVQAVGHCWYRQVSEFMVALSHQQSLAPSLLLPPYLRLEARRGALPCLADRRTCPSPHPRPTIQGTALPALPALAEHPVKKPLCRHPPPPRPLLLTNLLKCRVWCATASSTPRSACLLAPSNWTPSHALPPPPPHPRLQTQGILRDTL